MDWLLFFERVPVLGLACLIRQKSSSGRPVDPVKIEWPIHSAHAERDIPGSTLSYIHGSINGWPLKWAGFW